MVIHAVRATMVDGASVDLLQFLDAADARDYAYYVTHECRLLGYDHVEIVERRVIGKAEPVERRTRVKR